MVDEFIFIENINFCLIGLNYLVYGMTDKTNCTNFKIIVLSNAVHRYNLEVSIIYGVYFNDLCQ